MTSESLNSWDSFVSGNFLKAINVDGEQEGFICTNVEEITDSKEQKKRLRLTLEKLGAVEFEFDLNKTNASFLMKQGLKNPKEVIGYTLYFKKALVRNPKTNQEVESLRISKAIRIV